MRFSEIHESTSGGISGKNSKKLLALKIKSIIKSPVRGNP
jgi:hypothetical protein